MIVIDVGCASYPDHPGSPAESTSPLLERFAPDTYIGLDPVARSDVRMEGSTLVVVLAVAAWTHTGGVGFHRDAVGLGSFTDDSMEGLQRVPCIDIAEIIGSLPADGPMVVKIDAEGAEYPLLDHIHTTGADERLSSVLVEWHHPRRWQTRRRLTAALRCPVETWDHE